MSKERRREARIDAARLRLLAYDSLAGELLGSVTNLSESGLMLLSNKPVENGGTLQLELRRAAAPDYSLVEMAVTISWTGAAETPGNAWAGAHIIGISEAHQQTLHNLIEEASKG